MQRTSWCSNVVLIFLLHSDTASLNSLGYCRIEGRMKDLIIRGGENIYPAEVEQFLFTHPKVQEVQVRLITTRGQQRSDSLFLKQANEKCNLKTSPFSLWMCRQLWILFSLCISWESISCYNNDLNGKATLWLFRFSVRFPGCRSERWEVGRAGVCLHPAEEGPDIQRRGDTSFLQRPGEYRDAINEAAQHTQNQHGCTCCVLFH